MFAHLVACCNELTHVHMQAMDRNPRRHIVAVLVRKDMAYFAAYSCILSEQTHLVPHLKVATTSNTCRLRVFAMRLKDMLEVCTCCIMSETITKVKDSVHEAI